MIRRRWLMAVAALLVSLYVGVRCFAPRFAESRLNRVYLAGPVDVSAAARTLHDSLFVADLHSDALLWGRDLLRASDTGHVDLPRLIEGNVGLQVFSTPTISRTGDSRGFDLILANAITEGWPLRTWTSEYQRALYMAGALRSAVLRSQGGLMLIDSPAAFDTLRTLRQGGSSTVGAMLSIEGLQSLDGQLDRIDGLFAAGYRLGGLVHRFDNALGGSSTGDAEAGLTAFGRRVVARMETLGMTVDLAHASPQLIADVLAVSTRPVVVSHTGVRGTCDRSRNLSDEQLRAIAAHGGVIGIGFWSGAVCGRDVDAIAGAIMYAVRVAGVRHVALGSDFDGDTVVMDPRGMPLLTERLLARGLPLDDIRLVMGENVARVYGMAGRTYSHPVR